VSVGRAERLAALRAVLRRAGLDGLVLNRTDEHGSEYLPPAAQRLAWLTGFTGSAAQVAVLHQRAAVFSDGRYTVQLAEEVDAALFERRHAVNEPLAKWLETNLPDGARLGFDPFLTRRTERERLEQAVRRRGGALVAVSPNPVDEVWVNRPAPPVARVTPHPERYAGEGDAAKRRRMGEALAASGADWQLITATDAIAWLLNIRGRDIPYNPLCLSFALLASDGRCRWFVDQRKLGPGYQPPEAVSAEPPERLLGALDELGAAGAKVLADPGEVHVGYLDRLAQAGARLIDVESPILRAKAVKNPVELAGAAAGQRRDGAAVARFLAWLEESVPDGSIDELGAAARLGQERAEDPLFQGESFETISAAGAHAALPHYRVTPASNARLRAGEIYLVDSGGQYLDATTDITRTVAVGAVPSEVRTHYTLVLKGHIAIATALFPVGTTGAQLDSLARLALWRAGLDFDHGTGHGIGSYLCVHEGPQRIAKTGTAVLEPGMIVSNEPGYYRQGAYGIRIENLVVVEERGMPEGGDRPLLGFRTLTLCPLDRRLVDAELLSADERGWVDAYHARVLEELAPLVGSAADWLRRACQPL
jgi:Xaa-Pro aminopeptidase